MVEQGVESQSAGTCTVSRLGVGDEARWDAFVENEPKATFFHLVAWRGIIERELGHRCHYLYAQRDGAITGVLPLAEIRSRLFGHALISTPFCVYGGVVANDPESAAQLTQTATALAEELRVGYLELRDRELSNPDWPIKELYVTFSKPIHPNEDQNWQALSAKRRNKIRKGIDSGLQAHHDGSIREFYRVYAESVRNLGTPVLSRNYYMQLKQAFGDSWEITVITHEGRPVATAMSFYFRDQVHSYYAGSVRRGRDFAVNDFMYWALMQRARERGARV
ncbi:MAG: FemAB family XrtA/PEP-CTERM system-associated protein, partial [Rhodanobacter sp.]